MHDTKSWYASLTVWGAIVCVLASVLGLFRVHLDAQFQADLRDWLVAASTLAGGAASLYGRLRASRRILSSRTAETRPQHWRMNLLFAPILLLLLLSQLSGCSALRLPDPGYVAADRATYEAVAPEYAAYVHADAALEAEERDRRRRTLATWDARLRAAGSAKPEYRNQKSESNPKKQNGNDSTEDPASPS